LLLGVQRGTELAGFAMPVCCPAGPGSSQAVTRQRYYLERGRPVEVIIWWGGRGPRNVLVRRADGKLVVRPFRGLRRIRPAQTMAAGCPIGTDG